jgi:hypothetical protein
MDSWWSIFTEPVTVGVSETDRKILAVCGQRLSVYETPSLALQTPASNSVTTNLITYIASKTFDNGSFLTSQLQYSDSSWVRQSTDILTPIKYKNGTNA